jgi:hypothetical protein
VECSLKDKRDPAGFVARTQGGSPPLTAKPNWELASKPENMVQTGKNPGIVLTSDWTPVYR